MFSKLPTLIRSMLAVTDLTPTELLLGLLALAIIVWLAAFDLGLTFYLY